MKKLLALLVLIIPSTAKALVIPDASTGTMRIQNGPSLGIVGYGGSASSVPSNVLNTVTVTPSGVFPVTVINSSTSVVGSVAVTPTITTGTANDVMVSSYASPATYTPVGVGTTSVVDTYRRTVIVGPRFLIASSSDTRYAVSVATLCAQGFGASTTTVPTPGAGKHLRIYYVETSNAGATATNTGWRQTFNGDYGPIHYIAALPQYGTFAHSTKPGYWDLDSNSGACIYSSAAGQVFWSAEYEILGD